MVYNNDSLHITLCRLYKTVSVIQRNQLKNLNLPIFFSLHGNTILYYIFYVCLPVHSHCMHYDGMELTEIITVIY